MTSTSAGIARRTAILTAFPEYRRRERSSRFRRLPAAELTPLPG